MLGSEFIKKALAKGRKSLLEHEAKSLLMTFGIPAPRFIIINDRDELADAGLSIGYPVVLKVVSSGILHKTEAGGVAAGIRNFNELEKAFNEMRTKILHNYPNIEVSGFLIEEEAEKGGIEVIIGGIRDAQFGPAVMFGVGGIMVELIKDVSFRLAPVAKEECFEMFKEIKAYPMLTGYRGRSPSLLKTCEDRVNLDAVADCIIKVGDIMDKTDEIKEIEINPLIAYADRVIAVDARVILEQEVRSQKSEKSELRR